MAACLFLILFAGVADSQILSPLLPAVRDEFRKSSSQVALLFTGYAFCAGLSVLVWGPISDAFGRKRGLAAGLCIFVAGAAVSSLATGFLMLLAGRILTGMGASMLSLNVISYAGDFFSYERRGWAMGAIFSSYFAALILGVPFGAWFGYRFGWRSAFAALGALALALLCLIPPALPSLSRSLGDAPIAPPGEQLRRYFGFLRKQGTLGALLSSLFASAGVMGFLAFLGAWLNDSFGIAGNRVGLLFMLAGSAALLASPLAGSISDRIGKRRQFVASSIAFALLLLMLPRFAWGPGLFCVLGLASLCAAFRQGPLEALLTEVAPAGMRGSFIALKNSFSQLGIGLAGMFSGMLFERGGYGAVCLLGAISSILAAGAMVLTFRYRHL